MNLLKLMKGGSRFEQPLEVGEKQIRRSCYDESEDDDI